MDMLEISKPEKLLTTKEAARYLGVTQGRIRQLLLAGKLRGHKIAPRFWLIPQKELQPFLTPPKVGRPRSMR
jgi:excisionase family DNA binding protein